uniref:Fibronectin type-II domain-containing protein n=1 Tax=Corethron hystrix TaxID=216773 RepID=A0A7S1FYM2_9STRA
MNDLARPDLWLWLGDNAYSDSSDMNDVRDAYDRARDDKFYKAHGPIALDIPVSGTWDDHDYWKDDRGGDYKCKIHSQNEFLHHFNVPKTDPRHPVHGENQQKGIYSSHMFSVPDQQVNGIHVINLDLRYHKSPTTSAKGPCKREHSDLLGEKQWSWLENELDKTSELKIITSGIQVLPPTNQYMGVNESICAYDGPGNSFDGNVTLLGENSASVAGKLKRQETWSEIPQARARLLRLVQKYVNLGRMKKVFFLSGNMHWGEILAKKMPEDPKVGKSQTFYEVTASGIGVNRKYHWPQTNRVRLRTSDTLGDHIFDKECKFPFFYNGKEYDDCTTESFDGIQDSSHPWCSHVTKLDDSPLSKGFCMDKKDELIQRKNQAVSSTIDSAEYHQTTGAASVFGAVKVDWKKRVVTMSIFQESKDNFVTSLASSASVNIDSEDDALPNFSDANAIISPPLFYGFNKFRIRHTFDMKIEKSNSTWGIMFDIKNKASEDIEIEGIDLNINNFNENTFVVYTKSGTHVNRESYEGWQYIGTYSLLARGLGGTSLLTLNSPILLNSGGIQAFYVNQKNNKSILFNKVKLKQEDEILQIMSAAVLVEGNEVPFSGTLLKDVSPSGTIRYNVLRNGPTLSRTALEPMLSPTAQEPSNSNTITKRPFTYEEEVHGHNKRIREHFQELAYSPIKMPLTAEPTLSPTAPEPMLSPTAQESSNSNTSTISPFMYEEEVHGHNKRIRDNYRNKERNQNI